MKNVRVTFTIPEGAKELRCGESYDFYIAPISEIGICVSNEDDEILFEDDNFFINPARSIASYQDAVEYPDDEESAATLKELKEMQATSSYKNTPPFLKSVIDKLPMSEEDFCLSLLEGATKEEGGVIEMELSMGDGDDEPLEATFEIELSDDEEFNPGKLNYLNFDCETLESKGCASILNRAFCDGDSVLMNFIKYGDTFYGNIGDDDGFSCGCTVVDTEEVNCDSNAFPSAE